jgi:hypothetical protein
MYLKFASNLVYTTLKSNSEVIDVNWPDCAYFPIEPVYQSSVNALNTYYQTTNSPE